MFGDVYVIENMITGEEYVGQTRKPVEKRMYYHRRNAEKGVDFHLYRSMRKYGTENFLYYSLIKCHVDDLDEMERHYIFELDTYRNGMNMTEGGGDNPMYNPEVQDKLGKKMSVIMNEKIRNGEHVSQRPEVKEKLRKYQKDKVDLGEHIFQDPIFQQRNSQHRKELAKEGNLPSQQPETKAKHRATKDKNFYEKRKHVFDTYHKYIGTKTQTEIGKMIGHCDGTTIIRFKRKDWWKQLEKERQNEFEKSKEMDAKKIGREKA